MRRLPLILVFLLVGGSAHADVPRDCYHFSIDACTELTRQNPADAAAYLHRGHAYLSKGEYGQAHADYITFMELDGRYPKTLLFDTDKFAGYDRKSR